VTVARNGGGRNRADLRNRKVKTGGGRISEGVGRKADVVAGRREASEADVGELGITSGKERGELAMAVKVRVE